MEPIIKMDRTFTVRPIAGEAATAPRPRVEIYYKSWCSFSHKALALLRAKGIAYRGIDVSADPAREAEMIHRADRASVPQVFIDGERIGGYDELKAFVASGALAKRLGLAGDTPLAA